MRQSDDSSVAIFGNLTTTDPRYRWSLRMRRCVLLAASLAATIAVAGCSGSEAPTDGGKGGGQGSPHTMEQPSPPGPRMVAPADPASIKATGTTLFEWAFMDRQTGQVTGSKYYTSKRDTVESMIKPGIVGDWLRRQAEAGKEPS